MGNTFGGMTTFYLGWKGGEIGLKKVSDENKERFEQAKQMLRKWGALALILSWIPILGDVLVGIGGAMQLPIGRSFFWMTLGKFGRYLLLGLSALGIWEIM